MTPSVISGHDWDAAQRSVISAPASHRLLVDAGPGTGKTAVACARLGSLIAESDLLPSKTWMISFTRTAIAEIRARLHSYIGDDVFGVKVATVDAHAWTIHSGYDPTAKLTGTYEQNIERVLELILDDEDVQEFLSGVEHLVIDEAQDLVGSRARLVAALIDRLSPDCGITIFADEAQAIYGFGGDEDARTAARGSGLLDLLSETGMPPFERVSLTTIHRTSAIGLRNIFSDVRALVLGAKHSGDGIFERIREGISTHADGKALGRDDPAIATLPAGALVLFRTRSEALQASQFCDAPHSLRLSGYGGGLPAWLGVVFHDRSEQFIDQTTFVARWRTRVEGRCEPDYGPEDAWRRLIRMAGTGDDSLDLLQLRRVLSRRGGGADLAHTEFGLPGPIIGTIHASKGREADDVYLSMPPGEAFESPEEEQEEARVLFVGGTRARLSLRVGTGSRWTGSSLDSGRSYRRLARKSGSDRNIPAMIEIGRDGDLDPEGLVGKSVADAGVVMRTHEWLAEHTGVVTQFSLVRDAALDWNFRLVKDPDDVGVGLMSASFRQELWDVASQLGRQANKKLTTPSRIKYIRGLGCKTTVLAPDDPVLERLHLPWSASGFLLSPRLTAFTRTTFWCQT